MRHYSTELLACIGAFLGLDGRGLFRGRARRRDRGVGGEYCLSECVYLTLSIYAVSIWAYDQEVMRTERDDARIGFGAGNKYVQTSHGVVGYVGRPRRARLQDIRTVPFRVSSVRILHHPRMRRRVEIVSCRISTNPHGTCRYRVSDGHLGGIVFGDAETFSVLSPIVIQRPY